MDIPNPYQFPTSDQVDRRKLPLSWHLYSQVPGIFFAIVLVLAFVLPGQVPRYKVAAIGLSSLVSVPAGFLFYRLARAIASHSQRWWHFLLWVIAGSAWSLVVSTLAQACALIALITAEGTQFPLSELPILTAQSSITAFAKFALILTPIYTFMCWRMRRFNSFVSGQPNHHMSSDGAASGPAGYPER